MNNRKPINLDITKLKFPPMAIVSILHRASGVLLFLFVPLMLYLLHASLASQDCFVALQHSLQNPGMKLLIWILMSAVLYHLIAGIRHVLMDLGFAESLQAGKVSAIVVLALGVIFVVIAGVCIW